MLAQVLRTLMHRAPPVPAAGLEGALAQGGNDAQNLQGAQVAQDVMGALVRRLAAGIQDDFGDNFDNDRWPSPDDAGFRRLQARLSEESLNLLIRHPSKLTAAAGLLADEASREWLIALFALRILGHRHIRLASNTPGHWGARARAEQLGTSPSHFIGPFGPMRLFDIEYQGCPIRLHAYPGNVAWTFMLDQYFLSRNQVRVAPRKGDVIIDAGACFADTALAFAAVAGEGGRVHAFEIDPGNLRIAAENLDANPQLARRIRLNDLALGACEATLYLHGSGPGARVMEEPSAHPVEVTTIDAYAVKHGLARVDFIKMDVEGAEFDALQGAADTLRRWRPRLAISVYHHAADLLRIPLWIAGLDLGYELYMDHYTVHHEETVLYALPTAAPCA